MLARSRLYRALLIVNLLGMNISVNAPVAPSILGRNPSDNTKT